MFFRHFRPSAIAILLATSLLACSSKSKMALEVRDGSAGRDTPANAATDVAGDGPVSERAVRADGREAADRVVGIDLSAAADISRPQSAEASRSDTSTAGDVGKPSDAAPGKSDSAATDASLRDGRADGAVICPYPARTACTPGTVESRVCGFSVGACQAGTQSRVCGSDCSWGAWSDCGGTYLGPSPEVCGDGVDNDCNGVADDRCGCRAVAAGAPVSVGIPGRLDRLLADPSACLMYGLDQSDSSQIVVFDTSEKKVIAQVDLGGHAVELNLSPDGSFLIASVEHFSNIVVVDKSRWTATAVATAAAPLGVAVANGGIAYYLDSDWDGIHRVDLSVGLASDTRLELWSADWGELQISKQGDLIFRGEAGSSGSNLYNADLLAAPPAEIGESIWEQSYGFYMPSGDVFVGPSGQHVYYADHQFDAHNLALIRGAALNVFAEDSASTFAVSSDGILDAQLLTTLVSFPDPISAAALAAADQEVWTYVPGSGKMICTNVADFIGGRALGVREAAAGTIGQYSFAKLVADPARPRLYGLDREKRVVVSIDRQAGTALRSVVVGSGPTDLEIDGDGRYIYAGHSDTYAIAQIDAESFTFVKFIPTARDSYDLAPLGTDRIATIDYDQSNLPAIMDVGSGAVVGTLSYLSSIYEAALSATADGKTVFAGEGGLSACNITRYDVSGGTWKAVSSSAKGADRDFESPARRVVATPDGTSVFYAGYCLNGEDLTQPRYEQPDAILSVTPNGTLALSSTAVYRVADGTKLADLGMACSVQAVSPDSSKVYCATSTGIDAVSLAGLN